MNHANRNLDPQPGEFEPGVPPVEPDEGPAPATIPDDPEHERAVEPTGNPAQQR